MPYRLIDEPARQSKAALPLASLRPSELLVTELATIAFPDGKATLLETAPGVRCRRRGRRNRR